MSIQFYSTNLGLSPVPEFPQSQHPQVWADLLRIRNAIKVLQGALDSYTGSQPPQIAAWASIGATAVQLAKLTPVYVITSETIGYGNVVALYNVSGTLTARKADATDATKPVRAICVTAGGVSSGTYGQFVLLGAPAVFTGLTPGSTYYLSTTPGLLTAIAPATVGNIVQVVGFALDSHTLWFNPSMTWLTI
jgi:hypothetical protein